MGKETEQEQELARLRAWQQEVREELKRVGCTVQEVLDAGDKAATVAGKCTLCGKPTQT